VDAILFWILAGLSVVSALVTVTRRNPLASALGLAVSLVSVAGLFAMLHAHLLFILQILVYAGAIIVLIIFVIMLLNLGDRDLKALGVQPVKFGLAAAVCSVGAILVLSAVRGLPPLRAKVPPTFGTAADVGHALFGPHIIAFEIVGLILLIGIIGAVILAKKGE
jgi:NADH-quinone oxidoreductase subunit J